MIGGLDIGGQEVSGRGDCCEERRYIRESGAVGYYDSYGFLCRQSNVAERLAILCISSV